MSIDGRCEDYEGLVARAADVADVPLDATDAAKDRKSTRLNSSH